MQHFIDQHPKSPNISLRPIDLMNKTLRSHVGGRTDTGIFELTTAACCKPKVTDLGTAFMQEHIRCLDISVDNIQTFQIEQTLKNVFNVGVGLPQILFISEVPLLKQRGQVASLAVLVDGVAVVGRSEVLVACDDVGMVQTLDDVNLLLKEMFDARLFDLVDLDNFDCHDLLIPYIFAAIDSREGPLPQHAFSINEIVMHTFVVLVGGGGCGFVALCCALAIEFFDFFDDDGFLEGFFHRNKLR